MQYGTGPTTAQVDPWITRKSLTDVLVLLFLGRSCTATFILSEWAINSAIKEGGIMLPQQQRGNGDATTPGFCTSTRLCAKAFRRRAVLFSVLLLIIRSKPSVRNVFQQKLRTYKYYF